MAIFVSYRRADSGEIVGRIYDHLVRTFGAERVFVDVNTIGGGEDFVPRLRAALDQSSVVLAVIGPKWLEHDGATPDFVLSEIAYALGVPRKLVVPVLVKLDTLPPKHALPLEVQPLLGRHFVKIDTDDGFEDDVKRLIRYLRPRVGPGKRQLLWTGLAAFGAVGLAAWVLAAGPLHLFLPDNAPTTAASTPASTPQPPTATDNAPVVPAPRPTPTPQPPSIPDNAPVIQTPKPTPPPHPSTPPESFRCSSACFKASDVCDAKCTQSKDRIECAFACHDAFTRCQAECPQ